MLAVLWLASSILLGHFVIRHRQNLALRLINERFHAARLRQRAQRVEHKFLENYNSSISPAAADEDMDAIAIFIMMRYPDRARMRRTRPATRLPCPMSAPDPCAADPDKIRPGRNRHRFHDWLWRRFSDDDFRADRFRGYDWRTRLTINHAFAIHATACQKRSGQNQQSGFEKE